MYNKILRKLTSLSLLTILLTSTGAFVLPNAIPQAHASHNANLFVSAENAQFNNYMAGPQVIEVVVNDNDIKRLDNKLGEPDVTVNGKKLHMAQTSDGNWYGYFADKTMAQRADKTQNVTSSGGSTGKGLDFGKFCSSATTMGAISFTDTVGIAIARNTTTGTRPTGGGSDGTNQVFSCGILTIADATLRAESVKDHVVRQNKTLNHGNGGDIPSGQIGMLFPYWPLIQLYDLPQQGKVTVNYNKGGGIQSTVLTFDRIPSNLVSLTLDKSTYSTNSQIFATMNDPQLNIDPTDEDTWTWDTSSTATKLFYEMYTRNGADDANTVAAARQNLIGNITGFSGFMFDKNGILTVNNAAQGATIASFRGNAKFQNATAVTSSTKDQNGIDIGVSGTNTAMSFVETSPKSGIFKNWDDGQISNWKTTADPGPRGKSATIRYNDVSQSAVLGFGFGTLTMGPVEGEWNSGEKIPVTLVDSDANKNSKTLEHLDLNDPNVALITALKIGTPFSFDSSRTTAATQDKAFFSKAYPHVVTGQSVAFDLQGLAPRTNSTALGPGAGGDATVQLFSQRAILAPSAGFAAGAHTLIIGFGDRKVSDLQKSINNPVGGGTKFHGLNMFNYDVRSLGVSGSGKWYVLNSTDAIISTGGVPTTKAITATSIANVTSSQALINLNSTGTDPQRTNDRIFALTSSNFVGLMFNYTATTALTTADKPIVTDFFSFGIKGDGDAESDRVNNAVYRSELEETGADTGTFTGTIEYLMLNQINIFADGTYSQIRAINHEVKFVAHEDLIQADARAVRLNYFDKGSDGVDTQIAAQQDAPTHSGTVSFDNKNYKVADTVTITVKDQDLNVDNDLIDIYTTVAGDAATLPAAQDGAADTIGVAGEFRTSTNTAFGRLLDVQFGQGNIRWQKSSACTAPNLGLSDQGFTLVENGKNTGIFTGTFQIPQTVCQETTTADNAQVNTNGLNIKVNYVDFRDASGKTIEVSDRAGVRGTTGSVKLDRTVYPVPFGQFSDFSFAANKDTPSGRAIFPLHKTALGGSSIDSADKTVGNGDLTIHVRVNDRDFDLSAAGEDKIGLGNSTTSDGPAGPVKVTVSRGTDTVVLARMGGPAAKDGPIGVGANFNTTGVRELGPMIEIAPDAGIFQGDLVIRYTDGPAGSNCPQTSTYTPLKHFEADGVTEIVGSDTLGTTRFSDSFKTTPSNTGYCIRQGDILTVQYTDPVDASGHSNTVTDSATFDLRNGVLQSDKSVYIIGSDMILTLIEPDFNLDSQSAETKSLDLIEWDSHAAKVTMGTKGQQTAQFDAKPSDFRETGKDTGIFQSVIRIPKQLSSSGGASGTLLERGEQIHLEYTDWAPAGAKFIGDENQDIKLTIYTSNFGATVELDQKVYTWTDKVYITVVAPDHNFDSNLIDEIGSADENKIVVATRGQKISPYKLVETGVDTGVFTGEVILTGFDHEVDEAKNKPTFTGPSGVGPTDGFLPASDIDGVTVSFLYTKDQTVTGSALIRWNIGEVQFVEASYPANGQGVLRIIDPDMNLNPEAVDKFDTNMWSDSDAGGIKLTMTETNEATGIFEGTVYFTTQFQSSGNRLKVNEGDTVTGEYLDKTLPQPYTPADQLRITATTFIGTVVPPLERAPASNPRIVDAFGNELKEVKVDQQVQITADLANGQDKTQPFAYLVQIQDSNGVTVSLSWITGSLTAGQSLNPAQSWTPSAAGSYTAQIFVWESVDNPNALSPPVSTTITVV